MTQIPVYDAINTLVGNIPKSAPGIAYYIGGKYAWSQQQINSFPTTRKTSIAPFSSLDADWLDVENGDATPADAPGWLDRKPSNQGIYCSLDPWPQVIQAIGNRKCNFWIASPGMDIPIPNAIARQYGYFGIYDLSIFDSSFWQLAPSVKGIDPDMIIVRAPSGACSTFDGTKKSGITDTQSLAALQQAGIALAEVTQTYYDHIPNA